MMGTILLNFKKLFNPVEAPARSTPLTNSEAISNAPVEPLSVEKVKVALRDQKLNKAGIRWYSI